MVVPPCPGRMSPSVARSVSLSPSRSPLVIHAVYVGAGSEVTLHAAVCSLVHCALHPSPGVVPPSSHSSPFPVSTVPSPQRGPVTVTVEHWEEQYWHVCPYSAVQACPFWLPLSHCSPFPVSVVLSPQRGPVTVTAVQLEEQYWHDCPYPAVQTCPFWFPSSHCSPFPVFVLLSPQRGPVTVTFVQLEEQYWHDCPYPAVHTCPFWLPSSHCSVPSLVPLPHTAPPPPPPPTHWPTSRIIRTASSLSAIAWARSMRPSPSKSAATIPLPVVSIGMVTVSAKVPSFLPLRKL